jgi:lipoprotein-anchoring transpeptidase ErfK/SrfK
MELQSTPTPLPTPTIDWDSTALTIYAVGTANIRSIPYTSGTILDTVAAGQSLTAYGTVDGEILSAGAVWYRVSAQESAPEYIYSELVNTTKPVQVDNSGGAGKVIKVNLTTQHIDAYDNGTLVHDNLITSGQPNLMTPTGTFQIISKLHPTIFTSPWGPDSPYYYAPLHINYALGFQGTLLFLHDATWRGDDFGPGTQVPHTAADGTQMTGSHGCVEMSTTNSEWFYNWATIGTPLIISY